MKQRKIAHPYTGGKTIRPYVLGYGYDGSTDANIHYIAEVMSNKLGFKYAKIYYRAYQQWIGVNLGEVSDEALQKQKVKHTTVIPARATIQEVLDDLYDINNRSLVEELETELERNKIAVDVEFMAFANKEVS